MNILILSTTERTGGAAVAADRLMKALQKEGIHASMLVRGRSGLDFLRFAWERTVILFHNKLRRRNLFRVSIANTGMDISGLEVVKEADIIHLHWINQGFLSLKDIGKLLALGKPVVWTMHDMWPCTGICHHARECRNYEKQCGHCFYLGSKSPKDLSARVFLKKQKLYANKDITFVGCSRWLAGYTQKSALCKGKTIRSIPNPIDTSTFCKTSMEESRLKFHLPADKKLILFGAQNVTDVQKGISYLYEALRLLDAGTAELVVFGHIKDRLEESLPFKIHSIGYLNNEKDIASLYNAVNVFVTPSLEENLPNTIMEAMACGTPCAGFHTGGIPEMIDHRKNGYVARYKDAADLAAGIRWILENPDGITFPEVCAGKVRENYSEDIIAAKYISLYKGLLKK